MSPRNDRILMLAGALALGASVAEAQTIGDYSRAQRQLLENAMSQAAARSAGVPAATPAVAASAVPSLPLPAPHVAPAALPTLAAEVRVSGVFASGASAVAEVVVDATAYLLEAGQGVPGTSWRVESVAVDRVVLSRHVGAVAGDAEATRKVFALPAMR
jgi:type IV pilus biogenesis protein PilP